MRRLRMMDKILLAIFIPVWIVLVGLSVRSMARGDGFAPIGVLAPTGPESYPTVAETRVVFAPLFRVTGVEGVDLQLGDRLIRIADKDLRGWSPFRVNLAFWGRTWPGGQVPIAVESKEVYVLPLRAIQTRG